MHQACYHVAVAVSLLCCASYRLLGTLRAAPPAVAARLTPPHAFNLLLHCCIAAMLCFLQAAGHPANSAASSSSPADPSTCIKLPAALLQCCASCRLLGTLRAAPPAVAARLSPEASPRPYQPGLSLDAAARAAAESWQLIELVEEGAVDQAEAGWRELLAEKRAKLRGRVTELDIQHAAARMIQVRGLMG